MRASLLVAFVCVVGCGDTATAPVEHEQPKQPPPPDPVTAVEVSGAKLIPQGDTLRLTAITRGPSGDPLGRVVTWSSSDNTIASVSSTGLVTATGRSGTAVITATSESKSASVSVPVWWLYRTPIKYGRETWMDMIVVDSARGRQIPIRIRWPNDAPQPIPVVFEIGTNSDQVTSSAWGTHFMTSGYAVIHTGNPLPTQGTCQEFNIPANECTAVITDARGNNGNPILSLVSARDTRSIRDRLSAIARTAGVTLDTTRVAAMGTSRGGAAALMLAGYAVDVSPSVKNVSVPDSRFTAIIGNAPPGTNSTLPPCGCTATSWQNVTGPVFTQTSAGDTWGRKEPFDRMPAGDKYTVYFDTPGIDHLAFSLNFTLSNIPKHIYADYIVDGPIAFLDAYLRGSAEAKAWLKQNEVARGTNNIVQTSSK